MCTWTCGSRSSGRRIRRVAALPVDPRVAAAGWAGYINPEDFFKLWGMDVCPPDWCKREYWVIPAHVPAFPTATAILREGGAGEVTINGVSRPIPEADVERARRAIIGQVVDVARKIDRPVDRPRRRYWRVRPRHLRWHAREEAMWNRPQHS